MYRYFCYGLHVRSELEIPELVPSGNETADVIIRYGDVEAPVTKKRKSRPRIVRNESDTTTLWFDQVGGIEARRGRELIISPLEGAQEKGFRFLVSGIGLSLLLHQRNIPSLHASAVAVDGKAVAFLGGKGMGKSTTAAAFHKKGYPIVTDDVLPFRLKSHSVDVIPAFPYLKLFSDSVEAVFQEAPDHHPRLDSRGDKRVRPVEQGFSEEDLPLQCVYALQWEEDASNIEISEMSGSESCLKLLANSFALRMFDLEGATADKLDQLSEFVRQVPVRNLVRPRRLESIKEIPMRVKEDLQT